MVEVLRVACGLRQYRERTGSVERIGIAASAFEIPDLRARRGIRRSGREPADGRLDHRRVALEEVQLGPRLDAEQTVRALLLRAHLPPVLHTPRPRLPQEVGVARRQVRRHDAGVPRAALPVPVVRLHDRMRKLPVVHAAQQRQEVVGTPGEQRKRSGEGEQSLSHVRFPWMPVCHSEWRSDEVTGSPASNSTPMRWNSAAAARKCAQIQNGVWPSL